MLRQAQHSRVFSGSLNIIDYVNQELKNDSILLTVSYFP